MNEVITWGRNGAAYLHVVRSLAEWRSLLAAAATDAEWCPFNKVWILL